MSIKDLPHITVEQVLALRKTAIDLERQLKSERIKLSTVYKHNAELRSELADLKASLPKVRADAINGYHSELLKATKPIFHPHFEGVKAYYLEKSEAGNE